MKKRTMFCAALSVALLIFSASCGEEAISVSGEEVAYTLSAQGAVSEGSVDRFTNAKGWEIQLTRAQALVGPIYFYSGQARASLWQRMIGIQEAYACAAHAQFQSGRTLGEVPFQYGVDLLAGPSVLAQGERGESGEVRSVELHVQNPGQVTAGNDLAKSPEATYEFVGTATRGDVTVSFSAKITLPEEGTHQIVDSIPADVTLDEGSTLMLKLQLDRLFRDADFDGLASDEASIVLEPGTQVYSSMVFSLRSRDAFVWENTP